MPNKEMTMTTENFISDLTQLVSFQTLSGQKNGFLEAITFIQERVSPLSHVTVLPNNNEPIFLASNKKTMSPDICYMTHVDVVAGKPHQFIMEVKDGNAYGRGVSDMKFSIPVGYSLLNDLINRSAKLSFMLVVTSDEERGGFKGAGYLANEYGLTPKLIIIPDGGDNFVLIDKSKGVCKMRVSMEGRPAHASQPWLGMSALEPVIKLSSQLIDTYKQANSHKGLQTTLNLGKINSGISSNQVPPHAELFLDFRFLPEHDTVESLMQQVSLLAKKIHPEVKVEVTAVGVPAITDIDHPALQLFMRTLSQNLAREIEVGVGYGSHDGRHFSSKGVPFIMTKPNGGDIHGDHEYINIDSVLLFYKTLNDFLMLYEKLP